MSQRWPGWPCAGFNVSPFAESPLFIGSEFVGLEFWTGVLKGAPTGISQRWPGWPCSGFIPATWELFAGDTRSRAALFCSKVLGPDVFSIVSACFSLQDSKEKTEINIKNAVKNNIVLGEFFIMAFKG